MNPVIVDEERDMFFHKQSTIASTCCKSIGWVLFRRSGELRCSKCRGKCKFTVNSNPYDMAIIS